MGTSNATGSRARRGILITALVAVLLFAGLSAAWFYLASQLDERVAQVIEAAGTAGADLECADQKVFGYPFRLGLSCSSTAFSADGGEAVRAGALRTAAQIYRPNRIVGELNSPLSYTARSGADFVAEWELAQASAVVWTEGVDSLDVAIEKPQVLTDDMGPLFKADDGQLHMRRRGDDLDVALSARQVLSELAAAGDIPALDIGTDATITGAASWLSGEGPDEVFPAALHGRSGELRSLAVTLPGAEADLSGSFEISADGLLSGDFRLALADPARLASAVSTLFPEFAGPARGIAAAVSMIASQEDGRSIVPLSVSDGDVSIGFVPVGELPPLR